MVYRAHLQSATEFRGGKRHQENPSRESCIGSSSHNGCLMVFLSRQLLSCVSADLSLPGLGVFLCGETLDLVLTGPVHI